MEKCNKDAINPDIARHYMFSSPDCVKVLDLDGRLAFINPCGREILEIDPEMDVTGSLWTDFWPAHLAATVEQSVSAARGGHSTRFVAQGPTAKGTAKWWDVVVSPSLDAHGNISCVLAVSRDITDLKVNEQKLRAMEQDFHALADNMAQLAWLADADGALYWYNQRWFDYSGTTLDEMQGWGWRKLHHPDHIDRVVEKFASCLKSGTPWEDTFPLRGRDGEYRWFLSRAMPLKDPAGNIVLWSGTNTDITERRESSLRLRQLARLIELSHEAIAAWKIDGSIMLWNRGCEELYGYARSEAVGQNIHQLIMTDHGEPVESHSERLRREGVWAGEIRQFAKSGGPVWVESRREVIALGSQSVVLETSRDITERKSVERSKAALVGELNHRVKNTLAIVQAVVGHMGRKETDVGRFVAQFKNRLHSIASAHDILSDAQWTGADTRELISAQIKCATEKADRFELAGSGIFLPPQLAIQLALMLHELIVNACAYGALNAAAGRVRVSWAVDDKHELSIKWQEFGGPPVNPTAPRGFGTMLIERSNQLPNLKSHLTFEPEGLACEIRISLPEKPYSQDDYFDLSVGRRASESAADTGSPSSRLQPVRRVLIIEDEPLLAMEIEEILSNRGYISIGPIASLDVAIEAIEQAKFDIALVDGNLYGRSAEQILRTLASRRHPHVVLTGVSQPRSPQLGADAVVLSKPLRAEDLVNAIERELQRPRSIVN